MECLKCALNGIHTLVPKPCFLCVLHCLQNNSMVPQLRHKTGCSDGGIRSDPMLKLRHVELQPVLCQSEKVHKGEHGRCISSMCYLAY